MRTGMALSRISAKQARLGTDIFAALVIASVALALANLSWRLMGYSDEEPAIAPIAQLSAPTDIAPLLALSPFGIASGAAVAQGGGDLTLRAIFASTLPSESVALIAGADGEVIPVGIGDATPGGIVEAIDPEKVTLRTSGGMRILGFNPDEGGGIANAARPSIEPARTNGPKAPAAKPSGVEAIRSLIPDSSQSLDSNASPAVEPPAPPQSAAPPQGYRVGNGLPARLKAAGIQSGDIIQTFNGAPVTSGMSERELLSRAMGSGSARVELIRGGKQVSLTVPVR